MARTSLARSSLTEQEASEVEADAAADRALMAAYPGLQLRPSAIGGGGGATLQSGDSSARGGSDSRPPRRGAHSGTSPELPSGDGSGEGPDTSAADIRCVLHRTLHRLSG